MNNLLLRTLTGIAFLIVMIGGIVLSPVTFILLFAAVTGLVTWEFVTLVNNHTEASVNRVICTAGAVYLFFAFAAYCGAWQGVEVFVPYVLTLIYLPIAELYLKNKRPIESWAYAFAAHLYVALPFALLSALAFIGNDVNGLNTYNWQLPLSIFVFLWVNDTGAYCVGSLLRNRFKAKLFERISPKKSWVGSIGGGLFVLMAAALFYALTPLNMSLLQWLGLGLTVAVFGTWGDLVESHIKRTFGVKDSSNVLPGHGGFLDRFDSSLIAIPAAVLYLYTLMFL
ncbi:MAG: phosphatidate cytidylyltransferase [Alloprevotella sp.]|nr:phosphatidate cytidylyltransferase [Alloprevotella sp.]